MNNRRVKKVKELIFEKSFWQNAWTAPSLLFAATTAFLSFFDISFKTSIFWILVSISFVYMVIYTFRSTSLDSISLNLDGSTFEISVGDIFNQDPNDYKVIAFNEFFDTLVDDDLISENSLNGQYIMKKYPREEDIQKFNNKVLKDRRLQKNIKEYEVQRELGGNTTRYELGSIFKDDDYFLVAFSKFNEKNEANLRLTEYATCLLKFWTEVNALYNRRTVVLPLLGAGITRHRDFSATNQELLEVLIWTFKISKVKFKEPSKIKIVIQENQKKELNFYKLKELEKKGV
ncbi:MULTISPECIES: macro domain-containing protein [Bacillus]|uniref:macro domain-containing protein n=1 Tax=Bacillus TaxID=1386 RepID=UPI0002DD6BDE|nr:MULTISPECIES: macro domain-containing protein [Bacillus]